MRSYSPSGVPQIVGTTEATSIVPMLLALRAAQNLLNPVGPALQWKTKNREQEEVLRLYTLFGEYASKVAGTDAKADYDIPLINRWLLDKGFSIQLEEIPPSPGMISFATAGILDLTVEWKIPGERASLSYLQKDYPAFTIGSAGFYNIPGHAHPVICLSTQSDHLVYMTKMDKHPGTDLALFAKAVEMDNALQIGGFCFEGATIPMVSLTLENDISYMQGLKAICSNGELAEIVEALQKTRLRMNAKGARAQSVVAMSGTRSLSLPDSIYKLDGPFLTWWKQPGISFPILHGFIMPDSWSDPGDLNSQFLDL